MPLALRDLHAGHRTVMEAYLFDTALSVASPRRAPPFEHGFQQGGRNGQASFSDVCS